jgi:hypothetical protein
MSQIPDRRATRLGKRSFGFQKKTESVTAIMHFLRDAIKCKSRAETRRQIERVRDELSVCTPNRLRTSRAIAAMQCMDTLEARRLLTDLSHSAAETLFAREATAALHRLTQPAPSRP